MDQRAYTDHQANGTAKKVILEQHPLSPLPIAALRGFDAVY